jgi:hypothetical protein
VTVRDGVAVKLQGNREHPFTRGALCQRVVRISDRVPRGIAGGAKGHWPKLNPGGTSIAATVMEKDADMGRGAVFHDNRVEVERTGMSAEEFRRAFAALARRRA